MTVPSETLVFPTVSVDRSYGESVDLIEVDLEQITAYLRSKGKTDEEIMALSIHFAEDTAEEASAKKGDLTFGRYFRKDKKVEMYKPMDLFSFTGPLTQESGDMMNINTNERTNDEVTEYVVHELEHFVLDDDDELEAIVDAHNDAVQAEFIRKGIIPTLAGLALSMGASLGISTVLAVQQGRVLDQLIKSGEASDGEYLTQVGLVAAFTLSGLGATALSAVAAKFRLMRTLDTYVYEQYINNPEEIKARAAAEEYKGIPMVHFESKVQRVGDLTPVIEMALNKFGEFEATGKAPLSANPS